MSEQDGDTFEELLERELRSDPSGIPSVVRELVHDLIEAGAPGSTVARADKLHASVRLNDPLLILANTKHSARQFVEILVSYGPRIAALPGHGYLRLLIAALSEPKLRGVVPFLVSLWSVTPPPSDVILWEAGLAISKINDPSADELVVDLCRRHEGGSLQMVVGSLYRRRRPDAYDVLLEKLQDPELAGHAINALWKFGNPDALPAIEAVEGFKGSLIEREKNKAREKLGG